MTTVIAQSVLVLDNLDQPIKGAKDIRAARGNRESLQQVFRGLENGHIPARKRGRIWETTLRLLMNGAPSPPPIADSPAKPPPIAEPLPVSDIDAVL